MVPACAGNELDTVTIAFGRNKRENISLKKQEHAASLENEDSAGYFSGTLFSRNPQKESRCRPACTGMKSQPSTGNAVQGLPASVGEKQQRPQKMPMKRQEKAIPDGLREIDGKDTQKRRTIRLIKGIFFLRHHYNVHMCWKG